MKNSVTVSAPGKLMLLGEHAVVYGYPSLVTAVDQRIFVTVTRLAEPFFLLNAKDVGIDHYRKEISLLGKETIPKGVGFTELAVRNFFAAHSCTGGVSIETKAEFSSSFGFGSSSAVTVAVIHALAALFDVTLDKRAVFDLSYQTVLDVQKKGSGFDVAAAVYGGTLFFLTPGKEIIPLDATGMQLVVGYTGIKADTVTLIDAVKEKALRYPEVIQDLYIAMGKSVEGARSALLEKNWKAFGEWMDFDQGYLESLGVSSLPLAKMIHAAREAGALGAKLSGAGKGDCMIALVSSDRMALVQQAIKDVGGQVLDVSVNAEGVRVES